MNYYFDMDGVLSNFHKEPYEYAKAINREWIANLEPFNYNVEIVKQLIRNGHKVMILSKAASEDAKAGKFDWLKKYLPEIKAEDIIVLVGGGRKIDYAPEIGILVDDDMRNIRQWANAGYPYYYVAEKGLQINL